MYLQLLSPVVKLNAELKISKMRGVDTVEGDKIVNPIYHQIAIDIATKVVNGTYKEGDWLRGRSMLAGQYNVSPETVRRALFLLQDMGIVEIHPSVGVEVKSVGNAVEFADKFRDIQTLTKIKNNIAALMGELAQRQDLLQENVRNLVDFSDRYKNLNPLIPYEIEVVNGDSIIGKTISEVNFWHNTRATIVAVKRGSQTILSPGPHLAFEDGDIVAIVGDEESYHRAKGFLKKV